MEDKIGQAQSAALTRSDFLKLDRRGRGGPVAVVGRAGGERARREHRDPDGAVDLPRGTLDVMDDFDLWVPIKMGYFSKLGINAKLIAGPIGDALACTKFVAQNQADMGYPSPGVLTASIDSGIPVKSIWDMISGQVFDFALPANTSITNVKQLAGKKIALGSAGWSTIVDPILVGVGLDPKSVTYVNAGNQWAQSVESGQADAGLAWEGLRAQWAGQGLKLKYLIGTTFSKQPSNVYSVRADDLSDPAKVDLYTRFLQGMIMGLEFAKANPRAAAQITYTSRPALQKSLKPQAAYDSFVELATAYGTSHRAGQGWGWHYSPGWADISTSSMTSGRRRSCSARPTCSRTRSSRRRTRRPTPRRPSPTRRRSS